MIKMSIIIAMAMSITPILSDYIRIHKKLRAWVSLFLIVILNIINSLVFGDGIILDAVKEGINQGVIAVGLFSTGKNTIQYIRGKNDKNNKNDNQNISSGL